MSFLCMPDSFATDSYKVILSSIGRLKVSWRRDLRRSRFGEIFSTPSANGSSSEWRFVAPYTRSISRIPSSWMFVSWAISAMVGERPSRWKYSCWVRIMRTQQEYFQREGRSPTIAEIAQETNIQEEGILEILRVYGATNLHSLDEPFADGLENLSPNRDLLRSLRQETFSLPIEDRITLYESVAKLSGMQRKLIYLLFFREFTQKEAGAELGMSQRKISRERTRALERLRALLKKKIF